MIEPHIKESLESLAVELDRALECGELSPRLHALVYPKSINPDIGEGAMFRLSEALASRLIVLVPTKTGLISPTADRVRRDADTACFHFKVNTQFCILRDDGLEWRAWWPTYELVSK